VFFHNGKSYEPDAYDVVKLPPEALPDVKDYVWTTRPEVEQLASEKQSGLGGRLIRFAPNTWSWVDGVPEPAVFDLKLNHLFDFVQRSIIEIRTALATVWPELKWVVDGGFSEGLSSDDFTANPETPLGAFTRRKVTSDAPHKVYQVPLETWNQRNEAICLGPVWVRTEQFQ
jgi:hypothetical protein